MAGSEGIAPQARALATYALRRSLSTIPLFWTRHRNSSAVIGAGMATTQQGEPPRYSNGGVAVGKGSRHVSSPDLRVGAAERDVQPQAREDRIQGYSKT